MNIFDIVFLAIALAVDCFTVSVVSGVIMRRYAWGIVFRMSLLFGLFQAFMPFVGWLGTNHFSDYLVSVDHWIAFGLLAFIGGRMIRESFDTEKEERFSPERFSTQLYLAIATSIDALAVGISLSCIGYDSVSQLVMPLSVIGMVSLIMGIAGFLLGVKYGNAVSRWFHPELFGGIILIIIGIKVLLSHLYE